MTLLVPALAIPDMARNLLAGLVMIGVLVVIHELGHFLFAKLFRIDVPVFSVGMGPRLFGFRWRETDYRVSALPIGGYVQMAGADPFGEEDAASGVDPDHDFMKKPVWQRLVVMFAGPAFNLVLPFIVFTIVLMAGEPQSAPVVGLVIEGSPAERIGIVEGDRIVAVDDRPVEVFSDLIRVLESEPERDHRLALARGESVVLPGGSVGFAPNGLVDMESVGVLSSARSSRIGVDDAASPAGRAGLITGDFVTHVDGAEVRTWTDLVRALSGSEHELTYLRVTDGERASATARIARDEGWSPPADDAWANAWGLVPVMVYVGRVRDGSPAMAAGIRPLDRVWAIDGTSIRSWSDLTRQIAASTEGRSEEQGPRPISVELVRGTERLTVTLTPRVTREVIRGEPQYRPIAGIERHPTAYVDGPTAQKYYAFTEAVPEAIRQGAEVFGVTMGVLGRLLTFDLKPQEALGGPVEIFRAAGAGAEAGFHSFARLLGTISFSLGIVNLLPVPVLDGGQIVFYTIEGIRGRPLPLALRERVQMVGVLALAALMLLITVMDVNRWLGG